MKYELLPRSEKPGDLKKSVPLYGTEQMQVGLSCWVERHVGGRAGQLEVVLYGGNAGFDCPVALQCTSSFTWLQYGFPESMRVFLYCVPTVSAVIKLSRKSTSWS